MSSTYSRNSWPYKNIVISFSFFSTVLGVFAGCWGWGKEEGCGGWGSVVGPGVSVKGTGLMEGGWRKGSPTVTDCRSQCRLQWQRAVLSGCWGFWSSQRLLPGPSSSPRCSPSWLAVGHRDRRTSITTTKTQTVSYTSRCTDLNTMLKSCEICHVDFCPQ